MGGVTVYNPVIVVPGDKTNTFADLPIIPLLQSADSKSYSLAAVPSHDKHDLTWVRDVPALLLPGEEGNTTPSFDVIQSAMLLHHMRESQDIPITKG
ncbi:uncharacterized protein BJX67DRAFT_320193 [Aspergillus lucknowensis]|uniref:Uncharacterized protein n=1 Tax=Aspergillus lucknowensis TaxID=176173 RepID=A0ABR4LYT4_9EURO